MPALLQHLAERRVGCVVAAHAVNAAARGGRGGTEVKAADRGRVVLQGRPEKELPQILNAAVNVTTNEVGVTSF